MFKIYNYLQKNQINKSYIGEKRTYEKLGKFPVARVAPI